MGKGSGGTRGISWSSGREWLWLLRKLFTRDLVRWRRDARGEAPTASLLLLLPRRSKKSVRRAVSLDGIGSEIPVTVPLEVRSVKCVTLADGGRFALRRRRQYIISAVRTAPKTAPGKKPARMAPVGKDGQLWSSEAVIEVPARALG